MKIGIFGGTFNPPHIGHIESSKKAMAQLCLDRLIIVPAGIPPHKDIPEGTPSAPERLNMTRMSFEKIPNTIISELEIHSIEPCYTIETVKNISGDYPGAQLFLLMGADMYLSLEMWKDYETLLKTVTPVVFSRQVTDKDAITGFSNRLQEAYGIRTEVIAGDIIDISSSRLRKMLPERNGLGYITDTTYSYIIRNRLYGAKPNWEWLRERAHSMLDSSRIPHVSGCEEEALRLAKRWHADPANAREAAILHDITKKLSTQENINIIEEYGFIQEAPGIAEEKLLHAKTGAILAKTLFGASDEVSDAILWHTTGRPGMSVLEKVIYLADYIEPTRDLQGIEALRAIAYEDIDNAVIMGLEMTMKDITERGIPTNRMTIDALSDLKQNKRLSQTACKTIAAEGTNK